MSDTWEQTLQKVDFKSDNVENDQDTDARKIASENIKHAEELLKA
jgi:hypothetical protein